MKIKTSELTGAALDWAVAKCEGLNVHIPPYAEKPWVQVIHPDGAKSLCPSFSTDWSQAGPIIEREDCLPTRYYGAAESRGKVYQCQLNAGTYMQGPTPLIASMRCIVASKFGDEVEIPDELVQ